MKLAEQLGSFAGQLTESPIRAVAVEYEGHVAELNVKPLTAVMLKGLLAPQLDSVNMVNAPLLCRERDIRVSETRMTAEGDFHTLMRVTLTTERRTRSVAGTLFRGRQPRLVMIENVPMEAELGANMLFVRNKDKPGFIGNLGRTLGEAGINIATFHLGRTAPGEDAICLVQVDQPLNELLLQQVCTIPDVLQAKLLRF
jgi:D-3-phosphoglycerate dehydrogenase